VRIVARCSPSLVRNAAAQARIREELVDRNRSAIMSNRVSASNRHRKRHRRDDIVICFRVNGVADAESIKPPDEPTGAAGLQAAGSAAHHQEVEAAETAAARLTRTSSP